MRGNMSLNCRGCEEVNKGKFPDDDYDLCRECDKEIGEWLDNFPPMKPKYIDKVMDNYDH